MTFIKDFTVNVFTMFPLQVSMSDFHWGSGGSVGNEKTAIVVGIIFALIIIVALVVNSKKVGSFRGGGAGLFSGFTMHRMAREMGLNHEQIKMLDFVFKTDDVLDPLKSLVTPDLLDRHFRRAYRAIEQAAITEEERQRRHTVLFSTRNTLEHSGGGGYTSTRQFREAALLVIGSGKDKHEVAVVSTKGDNLVVECPKNALGSYLKLQKGTKLTVFLFTKNNKGFSFETRINGYSGSMGHSTMLLAHTNQIKRLSQRRYRRRQIVVACNMFLVYVEGSGRKQRLVVDKRRLTGNIADISVGGCSIKSKAPIPVGARMKIEYIQGDNNVAALGQVLRTNRAGVVTIIHVKFLKVTRKSMNTINAYVYEYSHE